MKLSDSIGSSMVVFLLQLRASLVNSIDCSKAGEKNQHAGCGKYVEQKTIPGHTDAPYWTIDVIPPPWYQDTYDCKQSKGYTIEACCSVSPRFIFSTSRTSGLCVKPDGSALKLK
ncbi:hypothetical protein Pst134EA_009648 [Puccinia striiformis f. sp. tritici]|uniref:hypothetical protein n=1 Tax=Puccinia striiformis f. sp. tritici TaxID=168172 RepID=UPI000A128380|nr:hypothetical protein Pst134EA_009648 [Puccinia striiformis f. sp. tritici]KAH9469119.1 hypothetical protein Pst134EA_009648 [Puccinia striiformis f. sp. tritici]KAI9611946.1 hypothetical protein H4Q26_008035 [Puccinia striiformis f. sp. tritici PST-130]